MRLYLARHLSVWGNVRHRAARPKSEPLEALTLAEAYVVARVVPLKFRDDARPVAIASVARIDALISWNFKHLVNLRRKRLVHSVNVRLGYPLIEVVSPEEVLYA